MSVNLCGEGTLSARENERVSLLQDPIAQYHINSCPQSSNDFHLCVSECVCVCVSECVCVCVCVCVCE